VTASTQEHYVATEHGRVYLEVEGEAAAELVLLAAGGPGVGHDHYHPWFSRLTPEFRVGYVDYSGCGRSDPLDDETGYSVELFAQDLEAVREHLGAESFSLIGLSFGGFPAVEYALTHPGRVRRLVLSNAQVTAQSWQRSNIDGVNAELERLFPDAWQELLRLREAGVRSLDPRYQELIALVVPDLEWVDPWSHPRLNRPDHDHGFEPAVYRALVGDDPEWTVSGALSGYDRLAEFTDLPPTLVLSGRYDRLTPPAVAYETFCALAPSRRALHVLERSAHRPWAEQPDEYFRTVKSFLAAAAL
jgi:proline iminopeptidase